MSHPVRRDPSHHFPSLSRLESIVGIGACTACRGRITKCTLERPRCQECTVRGSHCAYNVQSGDSSQSPPAKRQKLAQIQSPAENLYRLMQTEPFEVADKIFRRIRDGGDAQSVLDYVKEGDMLVQIASTVASRSSESLRYSANNNVSVNSASEMTDGFSPRPTGNQ